MINKTQLRGRITITRCLLAFFTFGLTLPFLGVRRPG
jgi:hypothetical protein